MNSTTASATLRQLRQLFAQFGMPETIVTDNGTQFTSAEFAAYCSRNGINHLRSPAYHPQSNGQAERFVDTFKRALLKLQGEGTTVDTLQTFLLHYRSTPNSALPNCRSPAEAFLGRRLRTSLDLMLPSKPSDQRNEAMEHQFNRRHGARQRSFKVGDLVYVLDYRCKPPSWTAGRIHRRIGSVKYEVAVGRLKWTRHTNQLRLREDAGVSEDQIFETFNDVFQLEPLQSKPPESAATPAESTPPLHELPSPSPVNAGTQPVEADAESLTEPRYPTRQRPPTDRLSITNMRAKSYTPL